MSLSYWTTNKAKSEKSDFDVNMNIEPSTTKVFEMHPWILYKSSIYVEPYN